MVAAWAIYVPWKAQREKELFNYAVLTLERAYNILTNNAQNISPVVLNRYNWLTAARHIERFKIIRNKIKSELYSTLCDEHQEYWRYRFNECLEPHTVESADFFDYQDTGYHNGPNTIEERSALVLFSFSGWPMGMKDPLDDINIEELLNSNQGAMHSRGLREHLRNAGLLK